MNLPNAQIVRRFSWIAVLAVGIPVAQAQTGTSDKPFEMEELEPIPGSETDQIKAQFRFELIADISLPGPLPGGEPYAIDDGIAIAVADGLAVVSWDGTIELFEAGDARPAGDPEDSEFAFSEDGKLRCSTIPEGWIKAEKNCGSCRKEWRKKWRVRAPGSEFARPLITDKRVYYGATDNRVYSVKRKNGHRVWATDIGGRVVRPLELLQVTAPPDVRYIGRRGSRLMDLVLVVPDSGDSITALEGRAGVRVARHELPQNESFFGRPLTHGAKIAVVRQRYDARDAALLLFELRPPSPPTQIEQNLAFVETDSNDGGSEPPGPPDRQ